jgi:hypothetical protein
MSSLEMIERLTVADLATLQQINGRYLALPESVQKKTQPAHLDSVRRLLLSRAPTPQSWVERVQMQEEALTASRALASRTTA